MAYNSNKIEGSTLTERQTASIFDTGTILADNEYIRTKDVEETTGHFIMFNEMLCSLNEPLSHELIKRYHFRLKSGVFEDIANGHAIGEYKKRANIVADVETAKPSEVCAKMSDLLSEYNGIEKHTIEDIAIFHAKYEKIHPFQDGNGRTGRLILFKECLKNRLVPVLVYNKDKTRYYYALSEASHNENYNELIQMFKEEQENYYHLAKDFVMDFELD